MYSESSAKRMYSIRASDGDGFRARKHLETVYAKWDELESTVQTLDINMLYRLAAHQDCELSQQRYALHPSQHDPSPRHVHQNLTSTSKHTNIK